MESMEISLNDKSNLSFTLFNRSGLPPEKTFSDERIDENAVFAENAFANVPIKNVICLKTHKNVSKQI